jgi:Bacterial archaeo-eukaryotic release factor family 10
MIKLEDVKNLLNQTDDHTLTLYLNVDNAAQENQAANPAWSVWAKNALRDLHKNSDNEQSDAWKNIEESAQNYLSNYQPQGKGLLIFAGDSFQQVYELPLYFENQVSFGKPCLTPLLSAIDEYEPYLVALVDQESARFFISYLGEIGFQESIEIDLEEYDFQQKTLMPSVSAITGGHGITQGSNREAYERMIDEHHNRFYREAVDVIQKLVDKNNVDRVILGGSEQSAYAVQHLMPDSLKTHVVGVVNIPMRYNASEIFQHILPTAQEAEQKQDMDIVNQVIDFAKSRGRGALGEEAVKTALDMQQVELLILPWPSQKPDLSDDLAFRALQLNSKIELVNGEAMERLNAEGGVAARLYYAP